jgi:hypothetical protein
LLSLQTPARFYTLVQDAFHAARLIFTGTASCDIFSDQLLWFFLAGDVPLLLTEFCVKNLRSNSVISTSYFGHCLRPISVIFGSRHSVFLRLILLAGSIPLLLAEFWVQNSWLYQIGRCSL